MSVDANIPVVREYEGFGEITPGRGSVDKALLVAVCLLNNPSVNQYFLDSKVMLVDRMTKTKVFPRGGMALPNGETYHVEEAKVE